MKVTHARAFRNGFVYCFLIFALVLPYVTGAPWAYVLIGLSLALATTEYIRNWNHRTDLGAWMLLAAFCVLAITFAVTSRPGTTDFLSGGNFLLFTLFAPLSAALRHSARPGNTLTVASLALGGAALSTVIASLQVFVLHLDRAWGWGSNPTQSATAALLLGFVALTGYGAASDWRRNLFLLGPVLGTGTVFLSGARGPFIALPALLLVVVLLGRVRSGALIFAAALFAVSTVGFFALKPDILHRFTVLQDAAAQAGTGQQVDADISIGIRYQISRGGPFRPAD